MRQVRTEREIIFPLNPKATCQGHRDKYVGRMTLLRQLRIHYFLGEAGGSTGYVKFKRKTLKLPACYILRHIVHIGSTLIFLTCDAILSQLETHSHVMHTHVMHTRTHGEGGGAEK